MCGLHSSRYQPAVAGLPTLVASALLLAGTRFVRAGVRV